MNANRINTAGIQYVRDHLANLPRPDRAASQAMGVWLAQHGVHLPPEQVEVVTVHLHPHQPGHYQAQIVQRMSLTQAVLSNWQGESSNDIFAALIERPWAGEWPSGSTIEQVEQLPPQPSTDNSAWYQVFNGLFRRTEPPRYDDSTRLDVPAETLQSYLQQLDFHQRFLEMHERYWNEHLAEHRLSCKLSLVAACNKQVGEGSLSEAARRIVWRAAGLMPRKRGLRLSTLNIYGYAATDLLYLNESASDLTVLYLPGNSSPLLEFASEAQMKDWVGVQCRDPARRERLKQHFRLADRPQGVDFSGLDTALEGLGAYPERHQLPPEHGPFNDDGTWPPRTYVNYRPGKYNPRLRGDLFQALAERQRQRGLDDAQWLITSQAEINERKWRDYLNTTLNLALPLSFVVPGLAPVLALGGIVQLGIGLDEAINGKTLQRQLEGVSDISYGLFNAVPLVGSALNKAESVFQTWQDGFVLPRDINGQWGYPLSPLSPPHLPPIDVAPYFNLPARIEPLPGADPEVAQSVFRHATFNSNADSLTGYYEHHPGVIKELELVYDLDADRFIDMSQLNDVQPTLYEPTPGDYTVRPAQTPGSASDASRRASLLALGVDLPMPLPLPAALPADAQAIPKQILSLWVGDKHLPDAVLDTLAKNAERLQESTYAYRLFLSEANAESYAHNLAQLSAKAPGIEVLPLEQQAFFTQFQQGENYAHYQAALDGNGGVARNYAAASDVLRYPMLHSEGGLYMDVDDQLLSVRQSTGEGSEAAAIDDVELRTTPDGLLLHPPVQNQRLRMHCQYNTSMIGSHPGNPTLRAISEEMHSRYQATPDAYHVRPDPLDDPQGYHRFAAQQSRLAGPALLNDVIDQLRPELRVLRQLFKLYLMPVINTNTHIDSGFVAFRNTHLPLVHIAEIGHLNSWSFN
ncbi:dermonecrotic toxin domain-containing protein [Pseudomonas cremoricolorata]|uniref:Mannosyltransferase n=1 Tax=Pseudomonas cremoricolorata TaxID=157783 RepID=A0A089WU89_9PSED|nr:DUF6543 domain-containing protein [Pseudomonas cremoricolorata]AIR90102.1 mannosyltransferase [Pseudomonas cremoricolorata]